MSKVVRSSKYRHVFGTAEKPENCFNGIKLSKNAWDTNYVAVNPLFIAACWQTGGGGAVGVIPLKNTGKLGEIPLISGHKGPVLDVAFSPFNDHILATASEDCTVKVWQIPEGGLTQDTTEAVQVLNGHSRKAGTVTFHPSANNILATSALDYKVKLWDIETGTEKFNVDHHAGIIQSVEWNGDGSQLATFCKDKKLRIVDPRSNAVAGEVEAHAGVKGGRCVWLTGAPGGEKVFTVGFSKTSERTFAIWDPKNLKEPLKAEGIDQAAGIIMPFWDAGSNCLYLAGKGDGSIRYYEVVDDNKIIYFLSQYGSNQPQQGMAAMPKRGVNVSNTEIMRFYKAMATIIEPISFTVPRKSDIFQEDLFPEAPGSEPALSAAEWVAGASAGPKLRSLAPGFVEKPQAAATNFVKAADAPAKLSADELASENDKLKKRVAYLEAELAKKDAQIKDLQK